MCTNDQIQNNNDSTNAEDLNSLTHEKVNPDSFDEDDDFVEMFLSFLFGGVVVVVHRDPNPHNDGYESPDGFHRHKCDECGHVWEHSNLCGGITKHHECPKCGSEEWSRYHGSEAPHK